MIERPSSSEGMATAHRGIDARRGFSLIEALVVLAVAGAALMLIFSVGLRATDIAFRLGRRALDVTDRQVAADSLRAMISGLTVPALGGGAGNDAPPVVGEPRRLVGGAVLAAATPCAGAGTVGRLTVRIAGDAQGDVVTCQADGGRETVLLDVRPRRAALAYSEDGVRWRDRWRADPSSPFDTLDRRAPAAARAVYVMLTTDDGRVTLIERARSGRPGPDLARAPPPTSAGQEP